MQWWRTAAQQERASFEIDKTSANQPVLLREIVDHLLQIRQLLDQGVPKGIGGLLQRQLVGEQFQQLRLGQATAGLCDAVHPGGDDVRPATRHGFHARALRHIETGAAVIDQHFEQNPGQAGDQRQSDEAGGNEGARARPQWLLFEIECAERILRRCGHSCFRMSIHRRPQSASALGVIRSVRDDTSVSTGATWAHRVVSLTE